MADCRQIPAQLADALRRQQELPANIAQYCEAVAAGPDDFDTGLYRACVRSQNDMRLRLLVEIADLKQKQNLCAALVATWTIDVPTASEYGGELEIEGWDADGYSLQARLTLVPGS